MYDGRESVCTKSEEGRKYTVWGGRGGEGRKCTLKK